MLQLQEVQFDQKHVVLCKKCDYILFDINIVTEFVRTIDNQHGHVLSRYFMLSSNLKLSTIMVDNVPFLGKTKPFFMIYMTKLKCASCQNNIGIKINTISTDIPNYEILGRNLIQPSSITINNGRQNVTQSLMITFDDGWEDFNLENKFQKQVTVQENLKDTQILKEKEEKKDEQIKYLRKSLEVEQNQTDKELIKQILSTVDFFTQILQSLEKRVTHTQKVCLNLKSRVQSIIPALRKT